MSNSIQMRRITATLRSGKKVHIPAWVVDSKRDGPRLLLVAAQHGMELQGIEAIRRFVDRCSRSRMRGKLFAVPFGNLPAIRERHPHIHMRLEQRYEDDRGHNMNRTWPGRKNGNDTERVSYAVYRAFGEAATHVLDLHTWEGNHAPAVLLVNKPEWRAVAPKLGHRFVHFWDERRGVLSDFFCSTGRLGVTYEFSGQYGVDEREVRLGLRVAINFAKAIGLLDGPPEKGDGPIIYSDRRESAVVRAPRSGLFVKGPSVLCGRVEKGGLLGHILSDRDLSRVELRSPAGGWLRRYGPGRPGCDVSMSGLHPYVERGEVLAVISWPAR